MLSKFFVLSATSLVLAENQKIRYGINREQAVEGAFQNDLLKIQPTNLQSCYEEFSIILNELKNAGMDIYYSDMKDANRNCYVISPDMPDSIEFNQNLEFYTTNGLIEVNKVDDFLLQGFKNQMARNFGMRSKAKRDVAGRVLSAEEFDYNQYHPLDEIEEWITITANQNPDRITTDVIGSTYNGNNIILMKIEPENGPADKTVYIDCGIHAREWISPAFCQHFVKWLLDSENYESEFPGIDSLSKNLNWHIVPVFNPDGYDYTWARNRMWRKNRVQYGLCTGVDLNRNYAANWGGPGSSGQCTDTYRGPSVFSELEAQAQRDYFDNWRNSTEGQNAPIEMYLTFHSYGQYVIFPYGKDYTSVPANYDELKQLSEDAAMAIKSVYGSVYIYGQTTETLYPAAGGSDDWAYEWGGDDFLSFTYELRDTGDFGFNLPEDQIQPTCEEVIRGVIVMGEHLITRD